MIDQADVREVGRGEPMFVRARAFGGGVLLILASLTLVTLALVPVCAVGRLQPSLS